MNEGQDESFHSTMWFRYSYAHNHTAVITGSLLCVTLCERHRVRQRDAYNSRWFLPSGSLHTAQGRAPILNLSFLVTSQVMSAVGVTIIPRGPPSLIRGLASSLFSLQVFLHPLSLPSYPLLMSRHLAGGPVLMGGILHVFDSYWILLGETHIKLQFL